ncbi:cell wall protein DAN4-like [Asterias rubens]|uniref:cell wall protein DAN4-like n=1 Tax=Asterias rubens TaxID=7604 RepID=UPI001455A1CB|nr:cell wall protein DAN4-like [Asterias rubens]
MAVFRSVLCVLFIAGHLSTCAYGTPSRPTPSVSVGNTITTTVTTQTTPVATTTGPTTTEPATTTGHTTTGHTTTGHTTTGPTTTTGTTTTGPVTTAAPVTTANTTTANTTIAPTTTQPITTGSPTTVVPPPTTVGNWTLKNKKGKNCMRMSFAAQMNVSYTKVDGTAGTVIMNLSPREAVVTSTCKSGKPSRDLDVYPFATDYDWSFSLSFEKTSGGYALTKVSTSWDYDSRFVDSSLFGFSSESYGTDNLLDQSVELGKSYSCVEPLTVSTGLATVMLWDMNLQPFAEEADGNFGEAEPCHVAAASFGGILVAVLGVFLLLGAVTLVVVIVVKKRKRSAAAPYTTLTA